MTSILFLQLSRNILSHYRCHRFFHDSGNPKASPISNFVLLGSHCCIMKKGKEVVAPLYLLDTCYNENQHANFCTFEIIVNIKMVFITIFPNFNKSLSNLYLIEALKIKVQILRAMQVRDAIQVTLYYQVAWRIKNHTVDLSLIGGKNALFLNINTINGTT